MKRPEGRPCGKSMRVLLDTNVLITAITGRADPYTEEVAVILQECAKGKLEGYIAFHSVSVIWYVLTKMLGGQETRDRLSALCEILQVISASHERVKQAIGNTDFKDFEDCLVDQCAQSIEADYIVSGNVKDFSASKVKALTPYEFCKMMATA